MTHRSIFTNVCMAIDVLNIGQPAGIQTVDGCAARKILKDFQHISFQSAGASNRMLRLMSTSVTALSGAASNPPRAATDHVTGERFSSSTQSTGGRN